MAMWVAIGLTALAVWWGWGPAPVTRLRASPGSGGAEAGWRRLREWWGRTRASEVPWAEIARACDLMTVCVEAGMPLRAAARVVARETDGQASEILGDVVARLELGVDERDAWLALASRAGLGSLGSDLARSVRDGTAVGAVLRAHAASARAHARSVRVIRARRVGVSAVLPVTVCFLPAFMLLGIVPIFTSLGGMVLPR